MSAAPTSSATRGEAITTGAPRRPIALVLVTGFLGSGKTTLLQRALAAPDAGETAVLVNEFGAVGLDHHLLWNASETCLVLENGCICCSVSDDFLTTLEDLFWQRLHRAVPYFTRVVIETTGLADALAVEANLRTNALVAERYTLALVVCAVDAVGGGRALDDYAEARAQVAAADRLVVTKTDLAAPDATAALARQLAALNPRADIVQAALGDMTEPGAPGLLAPVAMKADAHGHDDHGRGGHVHAHAPDVAAVTLRCGGPIERGALDAAMQALVAALGARLLRVKGIVRVAGEPAPLVVEAVGTWIAPLRPAPPGAVDVASDLTVIGHGLQREELAALFGRFGMPMAAEVTDLDA